MSDATPPASPPDDDVVLVDPSDRETGRLPKLEAHRRGLLHRAVSVFVFDRDGRVLLQRRAAGKYHSAGMWSKMGWSSVRTVIAGPRRPAWVSVIVPPVSARARSRAWRGSLRWA
jgi:hypothetical protein